MGVSEEVGVKEAEGDPERVRLGEVEEVGVKEPEIETIGVI